MWPHPLRKNHSTDESMIMAFISYETVHVSPPSYLYHQLSPLWYFQINDDMKAADYFQQLLMAHPSKDGPSLMPMTMNAWKYSKSTLPTKCSKINQVNLGQLHSPMAHPIRTAHVSETVTKFVNPCTKLNDKIVQIVMNMWLNFIKSQSVTVWPPTALPSTGRLA